MDSRGRGGDGRVREGRGRMSGRDRGWRRRGGGGNRGNEPGEASSSQAATQEESQSDSLHQFNRTARTSFPPPRPPSRAQPLRRNVTAAREVQLQRQGALEIRGRNIAGGSQQTGQSDSSGTAREEPDTNLDLGSSIIPKKRRTTVNYGRGSSRRLAQNQGLPQKAQVTDSQQSKISSQHPAFNPQNFYAPATGSSAGQVSVQGMVGLHVLTRAPRAPVSSNQQKKEKPLSDPRSSSYAKPGTHLSEVPSHSLPLKKRKIAREIMDGGDQERAPAEANPAEEQQVNPDAQKGKSNKPECGRKTGNQQ